MTGLALFEPPFQVGPHDGAEPGLAKRLAELVSAAGAGTPWRSS